MSQSGSPSVPFFSTMLDAHRILSKNASEILRFVAPWGLVLIALTSAIEWVFFPRGSHFADGFDWIDCIYIVVSFLVTMFIFSIICVPLHRKILLEEPLTVGGTSGDRMNGVAPYFLRTLGLYLCFLAALMALVAVIATGAFLLPRKGVMDLLNSDEGFGCLLCVVLPILIFPLAAYLPVRFSLSLPASAIGSSAATFKESWSATRGHYWTLFLGGLLSYWPVFLLAAWPQYWQEAETTSLSQTLFFSVLGNLFILPCILIWTIFFSLVHRKLGNIEK